MFRFGRFAVPAMAAAVGATVFFASPSYAATPAGSSASSPTHTVSSTSYSDVDVVSFLAAGEGPIASDHSDLVGYLPTSSAVDPSPTQLSALTALLAKKDPTFHTRVTTAFQSTDPYKVASALNAYRADVASVSTEAKNGTAVGDCAVVVVAAVLLVGAVATVVYYSTKVYTKAATSTDDGTDTFAAAIASDNAR